MVQRQPSAAVAWAVLVDQGERRAGDVVSDAQPVGDALCEQRLAAAQRPFEQDRRRLRRASRPGVSRRDGSACVLWLTKSSVWAGATGSFLLSMVTLIPRLPSPSSRRASVATRGSGDDLVPEMAHVGEDHRCPGGVGGGDSVLIAHRAARLDDSGDAGAAGPLHAIGEGEEGIGAQNGALRLRCRPRRQPGRPHRRGSSGPAPMPTVAVPLARTMAFDLTYLTTRQAKTSALHLVGGRARAW